MARSAMCAGIVLGIFCLSLILLLIVRYFVSKSRRDVYRDADDYHQFAGGASSITSGTGYAYGPGSVGSVYPGSQFEPQLRPQTYAATMGTMSHPPHRREYFANRPWYWWF